MPRARNIKPGFFMNEELAECDLAARLVFIGLWSLADREGRLEDRPKRIRAFVFPYEDYDVDELLNQLQEHGFILRYEVDGNKYIQVLNFKKHQKPHPREAASDIPPPVGYTEENCNVTESREKALPSNGKALSSNGKDMTSPADILNADILNADKKTHAQAHAGESARKAKRTKFVTELFDKHFWPMYPRKKAKQDALKAFKAIFPITVSKEQCNKRWRNIVLHVEALKAEERPPDKIPYPATFLRRESFDEPPAEMTSNNVPEMEFVEVGSEDGD